MNNILTPEEASTPITYGDFAIILEQLLSTVADAEDKSYESWKNSIWNVTDAILERIKDIEYKRMRDLHYFTNVLSSLGYGSMDHLLEYYDKYCKEFDRLNRRDLK